MRKTNCTLKKTIAALAFASMAMTSLSIPASAIKTVNIAPPKDSATYLTMTYDNLYSVLNSNEYQFTYKNVETGEIKTVAKRDGDTYISTTDKNGKVETEFVVDDAHYEIDYDDEKVKVNILDVPEQDVSVIDFSNLKFDMKTEEDGFTVEKFSNGKASEYYYFDANGDYVKFVSEDKKGNMKTYDVELLDETETGLFAAPNGFEIESAKYDISDTKTMKLFADVLNGPSYTMSFSNSKTAATVVKSNYDYFVNSSDLTAKTSSKNLALGAKYYTFDDTTKTYTVEDRVYNNQCPIFFDTTRYSLENIEKIVENKKTYLVETVRDSYGIYKFYWNGNDLVRIETVNSSDKVLDTTTFTAFANTADQAALTLPVTYKLAESAPQNIGLGEGGDENKAEITTAPVETAAPAETVPTANPAPLGSKGNPVTGNPAVAPAIIAAFASIAAAAVLVCKKKNK